MTTDLVSIIIPCFNNGQYVGAAIRSALAQTYDKIEVIVVDDGSADDSGEVIASFGERIIHLSQPNAGACVARNNGLAQAQGQFIKFLDADDILEPDCIQRQVNHAAGRDVVVFGDCVLLHENGQNEHHPSHRESSGLRDGDKATLATFLESPVLISTTLYRHDKLQNVGGFNSEVRRGQEHDLNLRLYLAGVEFEYQTQICFQYRQHFAPSRISVANRNVSHYRIYKNYLQLVSDARTGIRGADWDKNRKSLGRSAWRIARRHLRAGDRVSARDFFRLANELGGLEIVHGTSTYVRLVKLVGPIWAERISSLRHRIVNPSKPAD